MKPNHGLILATLLVMSGCSTTGSLGQEMAGWQGKDVDIAIEAWGAPEAQQDFGEQTVLIWRDRFGDGIPSASVDYLGIDAIACERMLAVADDGTITGWRWRGDACNAIEHTPDAGAVALARPEAPAHLKVSHSQ